MFEGYAKQLQSKDHTELNEIEYLRNWLKTLEMNKENYGLIHYVLPPALKQTNQIDHAITNIHRGFAMLRSA